MTRRDAGVEEAAKAWWEGLRPCGYSLEQHLANPTVNTTGEREACLAVAVASALKSRPQVDDVLERAAIAFFNEMQPKNQQAMSWTDDAGEPDAELARNMMRAGVRAALHAAGLLERE